MQKINRGFSFVCDVIEKLLKIIVAILLAYMTILAVVEVFRRYLFGLTFRWSEETIRFSLIWMTYCGAAIGFRKGNLVSMDIISGKLKGGKAGLILLTVCRIIILALSIYIGYLGFRALSAPSISSYTAPGSGLNMVVPYFSIPLGMSVIALFSLEKLLDFRKDLQALEIQEA